MKNAVILHGTDATSQSNWFPWLKEELEKEGWNVWVPDLPHAEKPNIERYNKFLFASGWDFNEDTTLIGHSSGSVAILGLLEALPKNTVINGAVLVGSFRNDLKWDSLKDLFVKPFDFVKIKCTAKKFVFVHSDDDPICPLEQAEYLCEKLGGEFVLLSGRQHFSVGYGGEQNRRVPEILEAVQKLV